MHLIIKYSLLVFKYMDKEKELTTFVATPNKVEEVGQHVVE